MPGVKGFVYNEIMVGVHLETEPRRFTAEEYNRLGEIGVISSDERVELIDGMICKTGPEGRRHVVATDLALNIFTARLKGCHEIRIQHPLAVARESEPEPDIAIVQEPDPGLTSTPTLPPPFW